MGFLFIFLYIIFIYLILEISVALLVTTGLEVEIARFQVVSMLTATGFTTDESELIARHPIRRKISIFLILFGVFSLAVMISFISAILIKDFRIQQLVLVTAFFGIILALVKNIAIRNKLTQQFKKHLKKENKLEELPNCEVLYLDEKEGILHIQVDEDTKFTQKYLQQVFIPEIDIIVLYVHRGENKE
jgi:hypothetical protein